MNLDERLMVTNGQPCENAYAIVELARLFI
jgi:hypothetical protein